MAIRTRYPTAINPRRVGKYPALSHAGGGFVWDEVLEYRVWCHPERGAPDVAQGNDYFYSFATYPKALAFARRTRGAEAPLALIRQRQHINEPRPGQFVHVRKSRVTEWPVEFLSRSRRNRDTLRDFFSPDAPPNRLDILRGIAKAPRRRKGR